MQNILLLTSCLSPIVTKDISNRNINDNLKDLNSNINELYKKLPSIIKNYTIVVADCSINYDLRKEDLIISSKNIYWENNITILNIKFNQKELDFIKQKGKGYSELLLIKHAISKLNLNEQDIIHKITGRYILKAPKALINYHAKNIKNNSFTILYSNIFKRTSCHYYTIRYGFLKGLIKDLLPHVNDYNGDILEIILFLYIKKNRLVEKGLCKRSYLFSYYSSRVKAGSSLSRKGSSSYLYQITRHIAFLI